MNEKKSGFVDVDELQSRLDVETVCRFYGVDPGELHRTQNEIRTRCFMNYGKTEETGDRVVSFNTSGPMTKMRCHNYGCGIGGNLVTLCGLLKYGRDGVKPRGDKFKAIRDDLVVMVGGGEGPASNPAAVEAKSGPTEPPDRRRRRRVVARHQR